MIMLKKVSTIKHPCEVDIATFFSSEPVASEPDNHCIPLYEVLEVPNEKGLVILVMPFLRYHDMPRFKSIGEVMEFFRQIFEVSL